MSEWIDCMDKMPEPNQHVIAYGSGGASIAKYICYKNDPNYGTTYWFELLISDGCDNDLLIAVTHWMALPPPPPEGDKISQKLFRQKFNEVNERHNAFLRSLKRV